MSSATPVALVTGVSSAIGADTATRLAGNGFRVFGTSRNHHTLRPIPQVETLSLDISDAAAIAGVICQVVDRAGRIEVVINNAGVGIFGCA